MPDNKLIANNALPLKQIEAKKAAISCKNLKKTYGSGENSIEALKGIDLDVGAEELTMLAGPSGSGKTTLLSIITTILTPDSGKLFLFDEDPWQMSPKKKADFCQKTLGIVFQSLYLVPTLTVVENIMLPLLVAKYPQKEALEKAMVILRQLRLDHRANAAATALSKGQQQRIAIARALVNDAKIIICDEPTSALDQHTGHEVMELLKDLVVQSGKTILVVTHDHRIFSFADRIVNMSDGQIVNE